MALSSMPSRSNLNHQHIVVGSFIEDYTNRVDIISFDPETISIKTQSTLSFDHPYPPTKLMFQPNQKSLSS
ncbi:hypothetical protein COLO4_08136 [Corchorus olitorius]|uniref:Uncharacterized protein n=1 Tax=Corchorus olitorius TaxID=93759 RepID=A0A1R3KHE4_9ROSI|nr:hypothetical protein COLO4_08136 [Corchorus olitorius]